MLQHYGYFFYLDKLVFQTYGVCSVMNIFFIIRLRYQLISSVGSDQTSNFSFDHKRFYQLISWKLTSTSASVMLVQ